MGWNEYHLTELKQGDTLWRSTKEKAMDAESGLEYEEIYLGMKVRNSFRATVSQLLKKVGDECSLTYDMGDSWHHTVRMVEIRRYEDKYIRFGDIGGEILSGEAPVRRRIAVEFRATRRFCGLSRIRKIPIMIGIAPSLTKTLIRQTFTSFRPVAASTTTSAPSAKCCTDFMKDDRRVLPPRPPLR